MRLDDSLALLKGMMALRAYLKGQGGSSAFAMPPVTASNALNSLNGTDAVAHSNIAHSDLAHLVARYGLIYSEDTYLRDGLWPGFDLAI